MTYKDLSMDMVLDDFKTMFSHNCATYCKGCRHHFRYTNSECDVNCNRLQLIMERMLGLPMHITDDPCCSCSHYDWTNEVCMINDCVVLNFYESLRKEKTPNGI